MIMATAKKQVGLRLSETSIKELESLAKQHKVSQSVMVAVLIQCAYKGWELEELEQALETAGRC
jgi:hypothetical protein